MALIPASFADSVVAIGFRVDSQVTFTATGFLYGLRRKGAAQGVEDIYRVYLVTNRHVFDGGKLAYLRFNPAGTEAAKIYDLLLVSEDGAQLWSSHQDPAVDAAAISINIKLLQEHGIHFAIFQSDRHPLRRQEAVALGLGEGDHIFALGFPLGYVGENRNYVIARHGIIARIRDYLCGASKDFLIDAAIYPGNSGGPVVTQPEAAAISGTKALAQVFLVGMISGYLPYTDVAISQQTRRPRITFEENSGLGVVVPIEAVEEVVLLADSKIYGPPA